MIFEEEAYLAHYGILRKSGRYPWGSGETPNERNRSFLDIIEAERKSGMTEVEIARGHDMKVAELRALKSIATNEQKQSNISTAQKLKNTGMSNVAIGTEMGLNESSIRNLLAPGAAERSDVLQTTASMLRREVEGKTYIDVGAHVENQLGISDTKLKTAVALLQEEGYKLHYVKILQLGTGQYTTHKILTKEGVPYKEVYANRDNFKQIQEHSENGGRSFLGLQPPINVDSKRLGVKYKEDGGANADGVIYIRPGVDDLSLGGSNHSQVRVAIDGTHYLKGMAMYNDDLPKGVDLQFNTNKSDTGNKLDALKPLKRDRENNIDADNPFGAIVRQLPKLDDNGQPIEGTVRSAMNIVNEEGDWDKWSKNLSTQFLSKQSPTLAQEQLKMTLERKQNEFDEIKRLTNPAIKKKLLESFADDADSSAVHLKAQALPRQRAQVILPITSLKDNEIYAPNFRNGERVVLVRHPHGGTFEIPELIVNNRHPEAKRILGGAKDAVGINHKVAERLSGADFDGDTVLVIPNDSNQIKTDRALERLKDFEPQVLYKAYDGMHTIDGGTYDAATKSVDYHGKAPSGQTKQHQMGLVSNLIADMTIKGANNNELASAVRHSMVVIDAEKHTLDYRRSARENGIPALSKKYQNRSQGGASTLISRAKGEVTINKRKARPVAEGGGIDKITGEKRYVDTGEEYVSKRTGKIVPSTQRSTKLREATDAHTLVSDANTRIEQIYADHSNALKHLANQARLEHSKVKPIPMSESAKVTYAPQVKTLTAKLDVAEQNAPRERQAQVVANSIVSAKKAAYPDMEKSDLKKIKAQALAEARVRTGARKERIGTEETPLTDLEWEAIQAGAISNSKLVKILNNSNIDRVKELATPRQKIVMTDSKQARAASMLASGYTLADVADQLGVSVSTLKSSLDR